MSRNKHPNKEIEKALQYAEDNGWRVEPSKGHPFAMMFCPLNDKECRCGDFCISSIWSTPKNPENHARQIRRVVDNCTAQKKDEEEK